MRLPSTLIAVLAVLDAVNGFQFQTNQHQHQHRHQHQRKNFVGTKTSTLSWKSNTYTGRTGTCRSSQQLNALPASTILASGGSFLASVGTAILPSSASVLTKVLRVTALFMAALLAASSKLRHKAFWPGLTYPQSKNSELLPGPLGCPFLGSPQVFSASDPSFGAGNYYRKVAHALGKKLGAVPKIWKYYIFGSPAAVVSGGKTFQKIMSKEFDGSMTSSGVDIMEGGLMPTKSLLFERSKSRHTYLRKLVGAALTPNAVAKTAPALQSAAEQQVSKMISTNTNGTDGKTVKFQSICTDYTLDVAWRQILGLELPEEEIPVFEQNVETWIKSTTNLQVLFRINVKGHPGWKAREYVISKIEERIDYLLRNGPDNQSTLSGMVFATDEEDPSKKLTREEVIENALILIFAGSETSANTLTNAMMFLGLHPAVWDKLVEEQSKIQATHGDSLTTAAVDPSTAPYLDAFLKETMRLRTVIGGIPRMVLEDIDVDGDGKIIIPKGYMIDPSMLMTHEEDPNVKLPDAKHMDAIEGFRPERWLGEASVSGETYLKPNSDCYVPYGFGPRYCLGKNLAQLEMKIFLSTMLRRLSFPKLTMLPENYDYSPQKKDFSVEWATNPAVIPTASDGVVALVTAK